VVFLSNGNIFYRFKESGNWSSTFQLTSGGTSVHPQVYCDTFANLHMVWSDIRDGGRPELYYKMKDSTSWQPDRRLTFTPGSSDSASIVVDDSQHVHVVWVDSTTGLSRSQLFYMVKRDTQWSVPLQLTDALQGRRRNPVIAADHNGRLHVVWSDSRDGQQWWNCDIFYKATTVPSAVEDKFWGASPSKAVRLLRIIPDPFTSFATVPGHSSDHFALYDISGRKVGVYKGERIGQDLAPGVYFLKPEGEGAKPLRIVKLR